MELLLYAVRHKATGELMPELTGRKRGYSHWNPARPNRLKKETLGVPRLLHSAAQATRVIAQWNANPNAVGKYTEDDAYVDITPDGRTKDDLEVVQVTLAVAAYNREIPE